MDFFKGWMFRPRSPKKKILEEIPSNKEGLENKLKPKPSAKEKMIVTFLWFLMAACGISFITYVIMICFNHQNSEKVFIIFSSTLSSLIGYFLGTNKERE